jgi:hypothetical protein
MKNVILMLMLFMSSTYSFAQSDSIDLDEMKQDIIKANKFYKENQLDLKGYDFSNDGLNKELHAAAISRKKSNKLAATGGILIGLGLATIIASADANSDNIYGVYNEIQYGGLGIIVALGSIPAFIIAGKHARESKKHIKIAREMYGG